MVKTIQVAPDSELGHLIRDLAAARESIDVEVEDAVYTLSPRPIGAAIDDRPPSADNQRLPAPLQALEAGIASSRAMLDLPDDWDDASSPGYDEATWQRAVRFLVRGVTRLWDDHGVGTDLADVFPGPRGSIDLDWRVRGHELLVNVPADPSQPATYYGDDGAGGKKIKGTLDPAAPNRWLLAWLAE
jgi:hypothetical protein